MIFSSVLILVSPWVCVSGSFSCFCNFFTLFTIQTFCYILSVPIFFFKMFFFCFLCICSLACLRALSTDWKNFICLFGKVLFCLHWLTLSRYFLKSPFFRQNVLMYLLLMYNQICLLFSCFYLFTYSIYFLYFYCNFPSRFCFYFRIPWKEINLIIGSFC